MLIQEYIQLVRALKGDDLLNFANQFFLCKYKGSSIEVKKSEWTNTYILTIYRGDREYYRLIHISDTTEDLKTFVEENLLTIASYSEEKVYRKLDCLCLSQLESKEDIIDYADLECDISVTIYDLDAIGKVIEDNKILRDFLVSVSSKESSQPARFNTKDKILYDLFTTGNRIADIKNSFIGSYIQYYLLELGPLTESELVNILHGPLPNLSSRAFDDAIKRNRESGIVRFSDGKYVLSDGSRMQLEEIKSVTTATEERLLKQFKECLDEYNLKDLSHYILDKILELYKAQNNNELATIEHQEDSGLIEKKLVVELINSLAQKGIDKKLANSIVERVLTIVSDSEYLSKVSATTLFTSLFNSNSLEDYLGKQKRVVFLDTQVLLQLLCVDYQDVPYEDSLYEAGKILYYQLRDSENYINLFTTSDYIREVSNHLFEAYNLKNFIHLPYIREFGPSKNIFYNFYIYLEESQSIQYSCYEEYIEDLLNTDDSLPCDYYGFVASADALIMDILNNIGITIKPIDSPSNLSVFRRDYDNLLGNHPKGNKARENDVLCMYYLSDQSNFVNTETELYDEPYFITLDTTILPMRKRFVENYQRAYWYIYPPLKFANRLSVMNLKLDSRKINYDIICMAETNFKASYDTISMLDIMSMFFKKEGMGNRKLPRLLAKIKMEEKNSDDLRDYSEKNSNNLPIDVVLNNIHRYYRQKGIEYLDSVSRLFEADELSDKIEKLLRKGCDMVISKNRVDDKLYIELDKLIKQQNSES